MTAVDTGPFVLALTYLNNARFNEYNFGETPYVHHSEHSAEQEARRLARHHEVDVSVFRKMYAVGFEVVSAETVVVEADRLASTLAMLIRDHVPINGDEIARMVRKALAISRS